LANSCGVAEVVGGGRNKRANSMIVMLRLASFLAGFWITCSLIMLAVVPDWRQGLCSDIRVQFGRGQQGVGKVGHSAFTA